MLLADQIYEMGNGMSCNFRMEDRPEQVTRAMQQIANVEVFFPQLDEVQTIAESIHQVAVPIM